MSIRDDILAAARAQSGLTYRLDPVPDGVTTTDCSLMVLTALRNAGVPLAGVRTAEQIRQACARIEWADVLPGDLLFYVNTYDAAGPAGPDGLIASHIGISLGAGTRRMIDAHERDGADVAETDINSAYWQRKLIEARRPPGLVGSVFSPSDEEEKTEPLRGIDVASHQGAVDWTAVAASGQTFGISKATGGTWYQNPTFAANWLGMKAAGLVRGAYHYAFESTGQPLPGDGPEAEADYFLTALRRAGGTAPGDLLALDIEDGNGALGDWCLRWLRRVERDTGIRPMLYTGAWFSGPHGLAATPALAEYPLWLAQYQNAQPAAPAPWQEVSIWQHSDAGSVPGVSGAVDMNLFDGTRAELLALGGMADPEQPVYARPGEVGSGILAAMAAAGTVPAMPSTFLPLGRSPAVIEEAIAMSGEVFRWHLPTGRLWVYPAA